MTNVETREVAFTMTGVKKMYRLGQIGGGTLQRDLQSWWARLRGKEDPNAKIGQVLRLEGETFMALNGVDLTVYRGEALGIIGGNGAGKSTLLKLLSRITAPTEGVIDIYGRIASMLEVGTGFQADMTGRENVYMNGAILGMTKAEIDSKMEDIIAFSEVKDFIDTPVKRYSSGMYVKLAFAVAAHLDSEIMIMDEVLAVGDMAFQKKCLEKMRDAATREGRTVLYVSHNMNTIRELCDRCIVMDQGKIIFDGDVETAIGLYMHSRRDNKPVMDFTDAPRRLQEPAVRLLQAEYVDKQDISFSPDERMCLRLRWQNLKDVDHLGLRLEVATFDQVVQSSFLLRDFYSGKQGDMGELVTELDITPFMHGGYQLRFAFFFQDEFGNTKNADYVGGMHFDKRAPEHTDSLIWRNKSWGNLKMPKPTIISLK